VLYPYAAQWAEAHDPSLREAAMNLRWRCAAPYKHHPCGRWVPGMFAHGTELDHFYAAYSATSLLVECSGGGLRASAPTSFFDPFRWYNPPNPAEAVREIAPALADFVLGEPIEAARAARPLGQEATGRISDRPRPNPHSAS
jgi:hypothetical protein